jgi:hypothetical protein
VSGAEGVATAFLLAFAPTEVTQWNVCLSRFNAHYLDVQQLPCCTGKSLQARGPRVRSWAPGGRPRRGPGGCEQPRLSLLPPVGWRLVRWPGGRGELAACVCGALPTPECRAKDAARGLPGRPAP